MIIGDTVVIDGDMSLISEIDGDISLIIPFDGESGIVTRVVGQDLPTYSGSTDFIPSTEIQVINTADTVVNQNIVIEPIPKNYGLITWNGSTLTVS